MSLFTQLLGAGIGAMFGGPIGAAIGFGLGSVGNSKRDRTNSTNFSQKDKTEIAYFTAIFSVLAKLSKADGTVSDNEVKIIENFMNQSLKLDSEQRAFAIEVFTKAKDDSYSADDYLNQLANIINHDREIGKSFLNVLHTLALADNILHDEEVKILNNAERIFQIENGYVKSLIGENFSSLSESYEILDAHSSMSDREIKKKYRKKCKEFHPDKLEAKGVPKEFIDFANEKMIKIKNAYDTILKAREVV